MKEHLIGIATGDPKGIGPEVVAKALAQLPDAIRKRCRIFGDCSLDPRTPSETDAAKIALTALDAAIAAIKTGEITSLVTAPVNKARLQQLVPDFTGHTGYLAKAFGVKDVVMMFVLQKGRGGSRTAPTCIVLTTVHIPIAEVSRSLTSEKILMTIRITAQGMREHFGIASPHIAVLGLNPHAGENGALGREEIETIIPAIEEARRQGINCTGPFPADSFFKRSPSYDAVIAMYHDQGLIPAKLLGAGHVVNMTLGLPFVRTDPAHGTAEDIAGKGIADPRGMIAAIELAAKLK
ncbi:MAG: 4-hydroxythreonine-4-phosphate dehydrogenase PdxA [Deltaproteobacteria bacterium]|nr:4-hydroxythreonine-4-phosphate dehydrogenase PdxA [Deltaproteobacteria bacterium]